jgi:hypothetical protein
MLKLNVNHNKKYFMERIPRKKLNTVGNRRIPGKSVEKDQRATPEIIMKKPKAFAVFSKPLKKKNRSKYEDLLGEPFLDPFRVYSTFPYDLKNRPQTVKRKSFSIFAIGVC